MAPPLFVAGLFFSTAGLVIMNLIFPPWVYIPGAIKMARVSLLPHSGTHVFILLISLIEIVMCLWLGYLWNLVLAGGVKHLAGRNLAKKAVRAILTSGVSLALAVTSGAVAWEIYRDPHKDLTDMISGFCLLFLGPVILSVLFLRGLEKN